MPQITYGFPTGSKDIAQHQWNNCPRRFTNKIIREENYSPAQLPKLGLLS